MPVTTYAAKYAAKKLLRKEMNKNKDKKPAGQYDPYFMMVEHPKNSKKYKKVKRQIPDYIPEEDAEVLGKVRHRAYQLDCCLFTFLGIRFGWSSVIGLIPAIGDGLDAAFACRLVYACHQVKCGIPLMTTLHMLFNIIFDFLIGLVPVVGDLIDAGYRANTKNVRLLEERLDAVYKSKEDREHDKELGIPPASEIEFFSDEEDSRHSPLQENSKPPAVSRPQPARVPTETRGGERTRGFFGRMSRDNSRRERPRDAEMGYPEAQESSRSKSGRQTRR